MRPRRNLRSSHVRAAALGLGLCLAVAVGDGCRRSKSESASTRGAPDAEANEDDTADRSTEACPDRVRIDITFPGASSTEIEASVVEPVEAALAPIEGIAQLWSSSIEGRGTVWAIPDSGAGERLAAAVRKAVSGLSGLPSDAEPPMITIEPAAAPLHVIVSRGSFESLPVAVDALTRTLEPAPGVAAVRRLTEAAEVISIRLDAARLRAHAVDQMAVAEALRKATTEAPGGSAEGGVLVHTADNDWTRRLGDAVIDRRDGAVLRVRDVATINVTRDYDEPQAWDASGPVELLLVQARDTESLERVVAQTAPPPGVRHQLAGRLAPRGCPSPTIGPQLDGNLDLIEIALPEGADARRIGDALAEGAPEGNAVWVRSEPLRPGVAPSAAALQVLVPAGAPLRTALLEHLRATPGIGGSAYIGPDRGHAVIELRHADVEHLHRAAVRVRELAREHGLQTHHESQPAPQLEIEVDRDRAARLGITQREVAARVRFALVGQTVGEVVEGGRVLPIRLEPADGLRKDVRSTAMHLDRVLIATSSGAFVPLAAVAEIRYGTEPVRILHHNRARVSHVVMSFAKNERASALTMIDDTILAAGVEAHPDVQARRLQ